MLFLPNFKIQFAKSSAVQQHTKLSRLSGASPRAYRTLFSPSYGTVKPTSGGLFLSLLAALGWVSNSLGFIDPLPFQTS